MEQGRPLLANHCSSTCDAAAENMVQAIDDGQVSWWDSHATKMNYSHPLLSVECRSEWMLSLLCFTSSISPAHYITLQYSDTGGYHPSLILCTHADTDLSTVNTHYRSKVPITESISRCQHFDAQRHKRQDSYLSVSDAGASLPPP